MQKWEHSNYWRESEYNGYFFKIRIHKIVYAIWAVFLICILISMHDNIQDVFSEQSGYVRMIELCMFSGIILEYRWILHGVCREDKAWQVIFAVAFTIRVLSIPFSRYLPTNDFENYYHGACYFAENGFKGGIYEPLDEYGIHTFAVQAMINGFFLRILSPTLIGMQILNCIYTAGICALIYAFGKEIEPQAGIVGACIYTFYPMGVISSHITTNTHGAAFYMLLGLYFFRSASGIASLWKRVFIIMISAVCLVVSNCYHPSVIIVLCGFAVYMVGCEVEHILYLGRAYIDKTVSDIRHFRGNLVFTVVLLLLYGILSSCVLSGIENSGYIKNFHKNTYLMKIVWGFNYEYNGAWNEPDIAEIRSYPVEERDEACMRMIKQRLQDPKKAVRLMLKKTQLAWFGSDNYDYFYIDGISAYYNRSLEDVAVHETVNRIKKHQEAVCGMLWNVSMANNMFIYCIWILAIIGIWALLFRYGEKNMIYLLMYIPLGWMAFIMISEMQSRYRYQGMTIIVLLAGYGGLIICRICRGFIQQLLRKCRCYKEKYQNLKNEKERIGNENFYRSRNRN